MGWCGWICQCFPCCSGGNTHGNELSEEYMNNNDERNSYALLTPPSTTKKITDRNLNNNVEVNRYHPLTPVASSSKLKHQTLELTELQGTEMTEEEELQLVIAISRTEAESFKNKNQSLPTGFDEEEAVQVAMALSMLEEAERKKYKESLIRDREDCIICQSAMRNYMFVDCRHIVCCEDCVKEFKIFSKKKEEANT